MAAQGGGGEVLPVSPRAQKPRGGRRRHKAAAACLPLDVIVEIAARSDAATLVRCAATCKGARRRIADDPNLRSRLRLRDSGRFLLPLLRGHLAIGKGGRGKTTYLVDTTAADTTRLVEATFVSAAAEAETLTDPLPVDSRGGLVLIRATATTTGPPWQWQEEEQKLLVCNPATGRHLALPPEPEPFPNVGYNAEQYVLLVGDGYDGEVGRPFRVLKAKLVLSNSNRRLMIQTFSSEHGAWSPLREIPTPNIYGRRICCVSLQKVLVIGDVVHWLCLTDVGSYVLMLHVGAARVSETVLPASFPCLDALGTRSYLLATDSAAGSPVVLVADAKNIRAWEQCTRTRTKTKMLWKARPHVLIEREVILQIFREKGMTWTRMICIPELVWFGERSGAVLLRISDSMLWLDLHSKKIVRCFSSYRQMSDTQSYCPFEVDSLSWVPTFSRAGTF